MQIPSSRSPFLRRAGLFVALAIVVAVAAPLKAQDGSPADNAAAKETPAAKASFGMSLREVMEAGGTIGWVIVGLSVAMVALAFQQGLTLRHGALIPTGLPEQTHALIQQSQFRQAEQVARESQSFLGQLLGDALAEVNLGYPAMNKAMEDSAAEQSARMLRRVEYFSVIGALAPMLGLLGTVWGMILAFMEFEQKANPQVSELAPGIYKALITTLQGLVVAIPSLALFAYFRNRVDELVAQASLMAEHVFADFRRARAVQKKNRKLGRRRAAGTPAAPPAPPTPRAPDRERPK